MNDCKPQNGAQLFQKGIEQENQVYWFSNEGLTSELCFHRKVYYLVSSIAAAYRQNNTQDMARELQQLVWVEPHVKAEPFLSIYESGLVSSLLYTAHACADRYLLDEGYSIIQGARETLIAKRERRSGLGLGYRADSECWFRLYEVLAVLKWKGSSLHRNLMMTPEQIISEYLEVEERCINNLINSPIKDPKRNERYFSDLGWCLLQVIKMAIRWCPDEHPRLIKHFNKVHGNILALKTGQFMAGKPLAAESPWYWDHELFKWCILGPGTEDEACLCHQWRLDSARAKGEQDINLESYRSCTGKELDYLLNIQGSQDSQELQHVC